MTDKIDLTDKGESATGDPGAQLVHTAYFYYLKYTAPTNPTIRVYEYFNEPTPITDRRRLTEELANHAINGGMSNVTYMGSTVDRLQRERKGFVFVALDGAKFLNADPVDFYCDDATIEDSKSQNGSNNGRHTFSPRGIHNFSIPNGPEISSVAYLYRAQSYKHKKDLAKREWEHYHLKFGGNFIRVLEPISFDDAGGTNMGPPPPPPARIRKIRDKAD